MEKSNLPALPAEPKRTEPRKDSITLRKKKLKTGGYSLYLDIYIKGQRQYKFLQIYLSGGKSMTAQDRENLRLAQEARIQYETDLIVKRHNLEYRAKQEQDFIAFAEVKFKERFTHRKHLLPYLRSYNHNRPLPCNEITIEWLLSFQNYLLKHVHNNTALDYMRYFKSGLDDAVLAKIIPYNPYSSIPRGLKLKVIEPQTKYASVQEIQLLAGTQAKIDPIHRLFFLYCCFTGNRYSDAVRLKESEIKQKAIEIKPGLFELAVVREFVQYKTRRKVGKVITIPLSEMAIDLLDQIRTYNKQQGHKGDWLFPTLQPEYEGKAAHSIYCSVLNSIKKWAKVAGLEKSLGTHGGRHSFGAMVYRQTRDLFVTAAMLGHEGGIDNTKRYAHMEEDIKLEAARKMPKINLSSPPALPAAG